MSIDAIKAELSTKVLADWCTTMFEDQYTAQIAGVTDVWHVYSWKIGGKVTTQQRARLEVAYAVCELLRMVPGVDTVTWMTTEHLHLEGRSYCALIGNDEGEAVRDAAQAVFDAYSWH